MKFLILLFVILPIVIVGQHLNVSLISNVNYQELHGTLLNDVWAYVDEQGNEYALVGTRNGVSIVDLSNPSEPEEVFWVEGQESVWRDLHVFGNFAYVTTEAEDGLLIIDLSPLPNGEVTSTLNFFGNPVNPWSTAHNLWIDEHGYCYIFGANSGNGGVIIYDIFTNPQEPQQVGVFDEWYVHDGFVRGDTMYLAHIFDGIISIVDISDKSNPVLWGTQSTPSSFAHNIWPSDDGKLAFTTDEVSGGFLTSFDVENPTNITELGRVRSSPGLGVIPHNTHFFNDYIVTSYYADGVTIHDVSDPEDMIKVGQYDTYPGTSSNFIGCWGAYPYLPSGILLASDIENGLFVLQPEYVKAARMQGIITDEVTNELLQGVSVEIPLDNEQRSSNINGVYKIGTANSGNRQVTFFKYGYEPFSANFAFENGVTIPYNLSLVPIPAYPLSIKIVDENNAPILDAFVRINYLTEELNFMSDGLGEVIADLFYDDEYELTIGKWGYITTCFAETISSETGEIVIQLQEGIYDDFSFDFGWSTFGNAEKGFWERGIAIGAGDSSLWQKPPFDSPLDCGDYLYVTGLSDDVLDNVTDGTVNLVSPVFDASEMNEPYIYYERWFFNLFGPTPPNDTLRFVLSNGLVLEEIDKQGSDPSLFNQWIPKSIRIRDFMEPTATMQLFISVSDEDATGNIVHAAFDHFQVTDGSILTVQDNTTNDFILYPNPVNSQLTIDNLPTGKKLVVTDAIGKIVFQENHTNETLFLQVNDWKSGVYLINVDGRTKRFLKVD